MKKSDSISAIAAALAKAQGEIQFASKDRENPHFKSSYADLASVWDACRQPLAKQGLSVAQGVDANETGVTVTTLLLHSSGEWLESSLTMKADRQGPQAVGSIVTYARRYSLAAMVGVAPADDDDGEGATEHTPQQKVQQLAKQHGMRTGADVGPSKEQVDALEKYRSWFMSAWTDEAFAKVVDKLKEEKSQWLLSQLKIVWDEAQRRVQLLAAESIDGDTFDQVLLWVDKTPVLRDLEKFLDTAINANPSPFNEEQKERLYSAFEKRQQRKG